MAGLSADAVWRKQGSAKIAAARLDGWTAGRLDRWTAGKEKGEE